MHMAPSELARIVRYIRRQADHCLEVSRSVPDDYLLDNTPRATWLAVAAALESVADEIEGGQHLSR